MFNFQKEVVLNTLKDVEMVSPGASTLEKKVRFHDGGEYVAKYIVDSTIYRTKFIDPVNFTLTITPNTAMLGKHVQILIELGLDSDYRGDYGSAVWYFRKPILIDVVLPNTEAAAAKVITDAINTVIPSEYKFIKVSKWVEGRGDVVITGVDSYQKVRKVVISEFFCEDCCAGSSEEINEIVNLSGNALELSSGLVSYTKNNVEFGTYDYVLHNLRLPTYANLRFTSPSAPEMPVAGGKYWQYSFAYCVPRGINFGGLSVAGQTNHSTTLHTFFVLDTLKDAFEAKWTSLDGGIKFEEVDRTGKHIVTILPDQYASSQDLQAASNIAENATKVAAVETKNTAQDSAIANKAEASAVTELKAAVRDNRSAMKQAHAAEGASDNAILSLEDIQ